MDHVAKLLGDKNKMEQHKANAANGGLKHFRIL
jgi:hypothetical protein